MVYWRYDTCEGSYLLLGRENFYNLIIVFTFRGAHFSIWGCLEESGNLTTGQVTKALHCILTERNRVCINGNNKEELRPHCKNCKSWQKGQACAHTRVGSAWCTQCHVLSSSFAFFRKSSAHCLNCSIHGPSCRV